jgi:hypothetical protein
VHGIFYHPVYVANPGDRKVIKKEAMKIQKFKDVKTEKHSA